MSTSSPPNSAPRRRLWAAPMVVAFLATGAYLACRAPSEPDAANDSGAAQQASASMPPELQLRHDDPKHPVEAVIDMQDEAGPGELAVRVMHADKPVAGARVQLVPLDAAHGALAPACPCATEDAGPPEDGDSAGVSVLDPECAACPEGVEALLELAGRKVGFLATQEVRTDAEGVARLDFAGGASPALWVMAEGLRPASVLAEVQPPGSEPMEVELEKSSVLRVRVEDAEGNAINNAELAAFSELPFWPLTGVLRGAQQAIADLPTGAPVQLVARAPGYVAAAVDVPDDSDPMVITLEHPRTLRGQVLHGEAPVAGATVQLQGESRELRTSAVSDREGRFQFANIAPGSYRLTGEKSALRGEQELNLDDADGDSEIALALSESAKLQGTVVDAATRKPLADAVVELRGDEDSFASETTDEKGHYTIDLAPGRYTLRASEEGHLAHNEPLTVAEGQRTQLDLALQGGLTYSGKVVDGQGQPVADARVGLEPTDYGPDERQSHGARTDDQGHFSVSGLRDGQYLVEVFAAGHPPLEQAAAVPSASAVLKLSSGASVTGVVIGPDGPLKHAQVEVVTQQPKQMTSAVTDAQGHFHLEGLSPGSATAVAVADGLAASEPTSLSLKEGASSEVELHLSAGLTLRGLVKDDQGRPIADAMIEAYVESGPRAPLPGRNASTNSDADGTFSLTGLRDGEYHLFAYHDGLTQGPQVTAHAGASDVVLTLQRSGKVAGHVASRSGAPVKKFMVEGQDFHSADGAFTLRDVAPDAAEIIIEGSFPAVVVPVQVKPGQTLDVGTIFVDDGEPLAGRVLGPDGQPAPGVEVTALPPGYEADAPEIVGADSQPAVLDTPRTATTDPQGRFSFEHLRHGTYLVQASGAQGSSGAVRVATGADIELVLQPGAAVHGTATLADGTAVSEGAAIFVGGAVTAQSRIVGGVFELRGLPSGRGQLLVTSPLANGKTTAQELSLTPGESRDVAVVLAVNTPRQ